MKMNSVRLTVDGDYHDIYVTHCCGATQTPPARGGVFLGVLLCVSSKAPTKIYQVNDHKGELSVYWRTRPTVSDLFNVQHAWERACAPDAYVVHYEYGPTDGTNAQDNDAWENSYTSIDVWEGTCFKS